MDDINVIEYEVYIKAYVDIMAFLGIISSIIFIVYQLLPQIFSIFPNYVWHNGILFKNCFLCVVQVNSQFRRNFGVFNEPGVYGVFLIFALYFALFKMKTDIKKITALLITLATTLSTNGYICILGMIIAFIFNNQNITSKAKKRILRIIILVIAGVILFLHININAYIFLTDKLLTSSEAGSGYERWRSVIYATKIFMENPIFGVGYVGWLQMFKKMISTATPINWLALYGILYGIIMNVFYLKNAIVYSKNGKIKFAVTIIIGIVFIGNIITQNMVADLNVLILILYQTSIPIKFIPVQEGKQNNETN